MKDNKLDDSVLIHKIFEAIVSKHNSDIAVIFDQESISYKELNEKSDRLSNSIRYFAPESEFIGISTTRSIDMIVGVLAILKSGKAYLPLDPTYPEERLNQIISDSGIKWVISNLETDKNLFKKLGLKEIDDKENSRPEGIKVNGNHSLAYILYTSGSTGKPKGVAMGHSSLANLLNWQQTHSKATVGSRTLQFAPLTFDVSFQEIFATLTTGGTLILINDKLRLDPLKILTLIEEKSINRIFLPFVALQYLAEMAVSFKIFPASLNEVITAGEQLKITPQIVTFFSQLDNCTLFNQYGPTECHVVSELKLSGNPSDWPLLPNIGKPIDNTDIYIIDEDLNILPDGTIGELCITGKCLSEGYLHQEELTESKFINWSHPDKGQVKIYKTGDLAKYLPNGEIEFLGRKDDQVKIRGNRIELGEIEVVLTQQNGIKQATVIAREDIPGQKMLVAYLVSDSKVKDSIVVRDLLLNLLPDYMVPSVFVWMDEFPKTTSGKVDRKLLPKPDFKRPDLGSLYRKPTKVIEKNIVNVWISILQIDKIGIDDNFFELGGNSLLAQKTVTNLKNQFNYDLPITKLYQFPTVSGIANYLEPSGNKYETISKLKSKKSNASDNVAIIGMTGRFPGARTIEELWENLKNGKESISFFSKEELDHSIPENVKNDPDYVAARGVIEDADKFDAAFFGMNPKLVELMDPQQRVFLEISWELLEKSGVLLNNAGKSIGVFAGSGNNTYFLNNVQSNRKLINHVGSFQVMTVNEKDYVASRTAYELNLKGPAVSVFSGCSTSLLAIAQAVESIRKGQCEIAIAGGVSITSPVKSGHLYQEGAMLSSDGHCSPFDDSASGTVFSDGAGVILLKNLEDAKEDGDTIYAVIKGIGVNNDGGGKGSFTAPSSEGQAGAIMSAIEDAGIEPSSISYVEAHGTGTPLGDPIEIEGLKMAFGEQGKYQYCAIGSVKGNLGHLTAAAGVTGLIKTTLSLFHKQIPASVGFKVSNKNIDFVNSPFYVNNRLSEWPDVKVRRAGVSSFGVGGTNVHVVLEEFSNDFIESDDGKPVQLVTWSAKTSESRQNYAQRLSDYIRSNKDFKIADIAYTLQACRSDFNHRRFIVASSREDFLNQLILENVSGTESKVLTEKSGEIVFSFPGQGSQYLNMGHELYTNEIVYKNAIDECAEILQQYIGLDIRKVVYPETVNPAAEEQLKNTRFTQPAIFITEYALTKLWMSWGIEPTILCGHSIGEFVAAHFAGVFTLEDALKLIATRGLMVSQLPKGSMLSVRLEVDELRDLLPEKLSIAAINNKKLCVVAGTDEEIAMFAKSLDNKEIPNRVLVTSHAFHSAMMDPILDDFYEVVKKVTFNKPKKPVISTVYGTWMKDEQAVDPQYWADHLRKTVRFSDALETIAELENPFYLEVGPGNVTATLAKQQIANRKVSIAASLERSDSKSEYFSLLKALGQLWLSGIEPDWKAYYRNEKRAKLDLPAYVFDKKRFWVEPNIEQSVTNHKTHEFSSEEINLTQNIPVITSTPMRKEKLFNKVKQLLEDASGLEMHDVATNISFLEMGLDSLLLTQVAITFKKEFGLPITFRQLNESLTTPELLIEYLDVNLPADVFNDHPLASADTIKNRIEISNVDNDLSPSTDDSAINLIARQIQLLSSQVSLLQNGGKNNSVISESKLIPGQNTTFDRQKSLSTISDLSPEEAAEIKKPFGATARIEKQITALNEKQAAFLKDLTEKYNKKTLSSKVYAQKYRALMSDPRVVSGFKPLTKEIVYPIVVNKSKGSRLWDIDGNEYIDALNGFGASMLGHQPEFIKKAVLEQVEKGYEVGPQHELAGEVCTLICELTGHERSALCSTGSEAVLGTMRIARTVTGRSLIVAFSGSYHGIVDEVIVRGTKKLKSFPAAPGIMPEAVQNMLILDYGTEESLKIIRERAHELAAVLVEPVQSRRPEFVPIDFLKQIRQITSDSGTALIFDEVITGFRMHPGGAQAMFGIKADIASYGKVVGAGIPIGVIAGKKEFMDALDGGFWQYGDESYPEIGVTYFAGTFVRHPLALASAKAALNYMKERGPNLQIEISKKAGFLAESLNTDFERLGMPFFVAQFGSLWKIKFREEVPYGELLFTLMRNKGIHIWDGFPCFTTESHTHDEINIIIQKFKESVHEMIEADFFKSNIKTFEQNKNKEEKDQKLVPPVPNARLGRDPNGNPAWFISDPENPGKFLQLNLK